MSNNKSDFMFFNYVDNDHAYIESVLNIYFIFAKPRSHVTVMPCNIACGACLWYTTGTALPYTSNAEML